MKDELYKKLTSLANLQLAWSRLKTAQNTQYKNYYRHLFECYGFSEKENLENLSERLSGRSFKPSGPLRFYVTKSSGLHRPITFLHLDDLIVYQAIANVLAERMLNKRAIIENSYVFSNILNRNEQTQIFFFKKWQEGYRKYIRAIKKYFKLGNVWVSNFDLAAYYDTISHDKLAYLISNRAYDEFKKFVISCFNSWSTNNKHKLTHGIPQGPAASGLIGELYLMDIDIKIKRKDIKYIRYVDDIKIFGQSREEVLRGVVFMEKEFKERGLIPHSSKYDLIEARTLDEAIGKNPSLNEDDKQIIFLDKEKTFQLLKTSFSKDKFNTSKIKYILKASDKNQQIYNYILELAPEYPDLVDYICHYLMKHFDSRSIALHLYKSIIKNDSIVPYDYVEGKYWELLSNIKISKKLKDLLILIAIKKLKNSKTNYALKYGLYKFICTTGNKLILPWLSNEPSSLLQMMIIPDIPKKCLITDEYYEFANRMLRRSNYEPGLVCIMDLFFNSIDKWQNRIQIRNDYSQVLNNTLGRPASIDSIGEILSNRYDVTYFKK